MEQAACLNQWPAGVRNRMNYRFSSRMKTTPRSFIREILKVAERPDIISFAGGLPNAELFATEDLARAAHAVISEDGHTALQYTTTEGYLPLREFIAARYRKRLGLDISTDEILITNGSQQCLDLLGKIFLDQGDPVAIECPGYLGAIQAFSLYQPEFYGVPLNENGPDTEQLETTLKTRHPRIFYAVPNSQNPSGITWSDESRRTVADLLQAEGTIFIEDDAYGELGFSGNRPPSLREYIPGQTIILGSFSKIVSPGMRMGWICAPREITEQAITAKQASDLHSNYLSQRIIARYLEEGLLDNHIRTINRAYKDQCDHMLACIRRSFPEDVTCTRPDGGMFLWLTLPDGCSSMELFERALAKNVAILPGLPFYTDGGGYNTVRLNFSNSSCDRIQTGIDLLGEVLEEYVRETGKSQACEGKK
jgi:Transcriptional regulators containing a DNA-binding HTH domain and an aminotransferase domain (MocR family) and their eukaryotic orthologs